MHHWSRWNFCVLVMRMIDALCSFSITMIYLLKYNNKISDCTIKKGYFIHRMKSIKDIALQIVNAVHFLHWNSGFEYCVFNIFLSFNSSLVWIGPWDCVQIQNNWRIKSCGNSTLISHRHKYTQYIGISPLCRFILISFIYIGFHMCWFFFFWNPLWHFFGIVWFRRAYDRISKTVTCVQEIEKTNEKNVCWHKRNRNRTFTFRIWIGSFRIWINSMISSGTCNKRYTLCEKLPYLGKVYVLIPLARAFEIQNDTKIRI